MIDPVIGCSCTVLDLVEVPVHGFGVGAGAFGHEAGEALETIGDATFLFGTAFVSLLPTTPQRVETAASLEASGRRYFAPIMAQFDGGTPDLHLTELPDMRLGRLLDDVVLTAFEHSSAVGCAALVRVSGSRVAGALINTSVRAGRVRVPPGRRTIEPDLRACYFDLDPMRHHRTFDDGFGWLVSACVRGGPPRTQATDIERRFTGDSRRHGVSWSKHSHVVLTRQAPASWAAPGDRWSWPVLHSDAVAAIGASGSGDFAFHADEDTIVTPLSLVAWGYHTQ